MIQVSWWLYNPFNYKAGYFLEGGYIGGIGEGMGPLNSHDFSVFYLTFSLRFSVPHFRLTPRVVRLPELLEGFQGIPRAQRSAGSQPGGGKKVMFIHLFSRSSCFCYKNQKNQDLEHIGIRWNSYHFLGNWIAVFGGGEVDGNLLCNLFNPGILFLIHPQTTWR